ncbi:MAG: quinolinate synthase NadA [Candidatus Heimdallarchaeota archaeon]|nr:quinolinate synthase NadA [Candidatus Heimdallarchaeota archaeon]MCG3256574.1 quinolinate synthase NadA [Candidatus Heimdallarchaeota archaeon]MCK4611638.1 quinolinate synthase NadA [Candidatus Heimdallarchaeota archaeon]
MVVVEETPEIRSEEFGLLEEEVGRLFNKLNPLGWTKNACESIAPFTYRINQLKKEKGFKILAHSYQTADIIFGIADIVGDSLALAKKATELKEKRILFCGVDFMAESVKILNPEKLILVPAKGRDCTLADSITGEDVRKLKEEYPGVPVVCYVNTNADVKAESDICCTSANAQKIIEGLEEDTIVFIPDENMGNNLAKITGKKIITWPGSCRTHNALSIKRLEKLIPDENTKTFAHLECRPKIINSVDFAGGTGDMHRYTTKVPKGERVLFLTEQGFIDRMKVEYPDVQFEDSKMICISMKRNDLFSTWKALENPTDDNVIELDEEIRKRAFRAVSNMLKY